MRKDIHDKGVQEFLSESLREYGMPEWAVASALEVLVSQNILGFYITWLAQVKNPPVLGAEHFNEFSQFATSRYINQFVEFKKFGLLACFNAKDKVDFVRRNFSSLDYSVTVALAKTGLSDTQIDSLSRLFLIRQVPDLYVSWLMQGGVKATMPACDSQHFQTFRLWLNNKFSIDVEDKVQPALPDRSLASGLSLFAKGDVAPGMQALTQAAEAAINELPEAVALTETDKAARVLAGLSSGAP